MSPIADPEVRLPFHLPIHPDRAVEVLLRATVIKIVSGHSHCSCGLHECHNYFHLCPSMLAPSLKYRLRGLVALVRPLFSTSLVLLDPDSPLNLGFVCCHCLYIASNEQVGALSTARGGGRSAILVALGGTMIGIQSSGCLISWLAKSSKFALSGRSRPTSVKWQYLILKCKQN